MKSRFVKSFLLQVCLLVVPFAASAVDFPAPAPKPNSKIFRTPFPWVDGNMASRDASDGKFAPPTALEVYWTAVTPPADYTVSRYVLKYGAAAEGGTCKPQDTREFVALQYRIGPIGTGAKGQTVCWTIQAKFADKAKKITNGPVSEVQTVTIPGLPQIPANAVKFDVEKKAKAWHGAAQRSVETAVIKLNSTPATNNFYGKFKVVMGDSCTAAAIGGEQGFMGIQDSGKFHVQPPYSPTVQDVKLCVKYVLLPPANSMEYISAPWVDWVMVGKIF